MLLGFFSFSLTKKILNQIALPGVGGKKLLGTEVKKLHEKSKTLDLEGEKVLVCCKLCTKNTCMVGFCFVLSLG